MSDQPRLIELAFLLKQASLDSVHEKNVRHGHISTLHIWPARRPLAACRAALIATLLPDPGDAEERRRLIERIGGRVVPKIEKKNVAGNRVEVEREETVGGILHWGRESSPDLQFFRDEIRKAYGGRAPRKCAIGTRAPLALPDANQTSLVARLRRGRAGRRPALSHPVVDDFSRKCLAGVVDTSIAACAWVRELERLVMERGAPRVIVSDNGC